MSQNGVKISPYKMNEQNNSTEFSLHSEFSFKCRSLSASRDEILLIRQETLPNLSAIKSQSSIIKYATRAPQITNSLRVSFGAPLASEREMRKSAASSIFSLFSAISNKNMRDLARRETPSLFWAGVQPAGRERASLVPRHVFCN